MADTNDTYIPNDILISILKRLPSKTLIQFLIVSKSWYSLITNPNFINSHLHHHKSLSLLHPNHHLFLLESHFRCSLFRYGDHFYQRTFIPSPPGEFGSVAASYNGLICFFDSKLRNLLLWNPSINKFLQIEQPPILHSSSFQMFSIVGLGFNPIENDYKLVLFDYDRMYAYGGEDYSPLNVQVYSVNGDVNLGWKRLILPPSFPCDDLSHVSEACVVNDFIHWIVFRGGIDQVNEHMMGMKEFGASILSFDPRNDCFGEIQLPKCLIKEVDPDLCLAVIDDSLVVIHLGASEDTLLKYSAIVWKMEEYGVEESWKVLYRINLPYVFGTNWNIWDKEEGRVFITTSWGTLIVFHANNGSSSGFSGEVAMIGGQAFDYTESLVLLDGFSGASWLHME